jgi:hypothetical protein
VVWAFTCGSSCLKKPITSVDQCIVLLQARANSYITLCSPFTRLRRTVVTAEWYHRHPSSYMRRYVTVPTPPSSGQASHSPSEATLDSLSHAMDMARRRELPPYLESKLSMMVSKQPYYDEKMKCEGCLLSCSGCSD